MKSRVNFKTSSTLRETGTVDRRRTLQVLASCYDGATEAALFGARRHLSADVSARQDLGEDAQPEIELPVAPGAVGQASAKAAP